MPKIKPGIIEETITDEDLDQLAQDEREEEKKLIRKPRKNKNFLTPGDYGFNSDIPPAPTGQPFPAMLLLKYKQLLEQLVQKQNFWTKGKNVRNDGPRMWDLLQQTAAILKDPIPDNVKAKVQQLGGKV